MRAAEPSSRARADAGPAASREQLSKALAASLVAVAANPKNPALLGQLATLHTQLGQHAAAQATLRVLCDVAPGQARLLIALAGAQMRCGENAASIATLRQATAVAPLDVDAHNALGAALVMSNQRDEGRAVLRHAVDLDPTRPQAINLLCDLWIQDDDLDAAKSLLESLVLRSPQNIDVRYKLGYVDLLANDFEAAEYHLAEVARVQPDFAPTYLNLGSIATWQRQPEKAEALFRRALALQPGFLDALDNLSMVLRAQGKYRDGWAAAKAHAASVPPTVERPFPSIPLWDGKTDSNASLLVYCEQGLGDTVQFARYLRLARRRVGRIVLASDGYFQSVKRLLQGVEGVDEVLDAASTQVGVWRVCSLLSLAFLLDLDSPDPEPTFPYLTLQQADVAMWARRLEPYPRPRVGLVWAGSPRPSQRLSNIIDRRRSVSLATMQPLLDLPGIQFVSLQLEDDDATASHMLRFARDLHDMADTAALIAGLDLVITVDTAVAHVAGAIAKPVWLLNRFDSCWRWGNDGEHTPWYPTMRIFRQETFGAWSPVIERVAIELAAWRDAKRR